MREIRPSGLEGGAAPTTPLLPLSALLQQALVKLGLSIGGFDWAAGEANVELYT